MLDKIENETESNNENLLEDSDEEYRAEKPILDNKEESHQLLMWRWSVGYRRANS